jgi:hypothetical protein
MANMSLDPEKAVNSDSHRDEPAGASRRPIASKAAEFELQVLGPAIHYVGLRLDQIFCSQPFPCAGLQVNLLSKTQ